MQILAEKNVPQTPWLFQQWLIYIDTYAIWSLANYRRYIHHRQSVFNNSYSRTIHYVMMGIGLTTDCIQIARVGTHNLGVTRIIYSCLPTARWRQLLVDNFALQWRHNERDQVSNHQPHDCLLNRLFSRRSKKSSKSRVTSLCEGNSPVTGEFLAQRASNAENVSIWWRPHVKHLHEHESNKYSS